MPTTNASSGASSSSPSAELIAQINDLMHEGFELPMEKLLPEATLIADLGLDSLDAVDMLVHLEDKLKIKVDGEKVRGLKTLSDVYIFAAESIEHSARETAEA